VHLLGDVRPFAQLTIFGPALRQIQLSAKRPVQRARALGLLSHILGAYHYLTVGPLAQSPTTVLASDSHGGFPLLRKGGVVQHKDATTCGTLLAQGPHASAIELEGVPIGIGKQMLQVLGGSARECRGNGIAVLAIEVGKEPGYVALQGLAALGATKQRGEGLEEG